MMEYKVAQFYGKFVQKVPTGLFTLIVTSKRPKKSYDIWATFERNCFQMSDHFQQILCYFRLFNTVESILKIAGDWIRTADLRCLKQLL